MRFRRYRDFILVVEASEPSDGEDSLSAVVTVFDSPVGQGERCEAASIPGQLQRRERWLGERRFDKALADQIAFGEAIADILLPPYARELFERSIARLADDEGLRMRLRLDRPLADMPWEYCYIRREGSHGADGFLALDPRISIVRHEALAAPGDWFSAPEKRRVLVAMASPTPYETYPRLTALPREQELIREALKKAGGVDALFLPAELPTGSAGGAGVTLKLVAQALMKRADVFHFSGHGVFSRDLATQEADAALIFCDEAGAATPVSAARLGGLLKSKGVRLAVLGACEGGRRDGRNAWNGVAAALLRAGIPVVVAMQYTIEDSLAAEFMSAFYQGLVAGHLVDEAVAAGRAAIRLAATDDKKDIRDWGVPVLYMRSQEGVVFNPVGDAEAAQAAGQIADTIVDQQIKTVQKTGRVVGVVAKTLASGVEVKQKFEESVQGVAVGGYVFGMEGGRLKVIQTADSVSGTLIGVIYGEKASADQAEVEALAKLEKFLKAVGPSSQPD